MTTTADAIRNRSPEEFPERCRTCGGPVMTLGDRVVPVWVHARHRDWVQAPHSVVRGVTLPAV